MRVGRAYLSVKPSRGTVLRLIVSVLVVTVVLARVGPARALAAIAKLRPGYVVLGLALVVLAVVVSGVQWRLLLGSQGVGVTLSAATALYFLGLFFNNFLPSSIGGDVARVWAMSRETGRTNESTASVVSDRIFGAMGLAVTSLVALAVGFGRAKTYLLPILVVAVCAAGLVLAARTPRWISALVGRTFGDRTPAADRVSDVARLVNVSIVDRPTALACLALSVLFQLVIVAVNVVILRGMGLGVPALQLVAIVPVISAVSALPISLNGLGVREAAYVYLLGGLGVDPARAALASLVFFVMVLLVSLAGGVVLVARRRGERLEGRRAREQQLARV